eukprot:IDg11174t1
MLFYENLGFTPGAFLKLFSRTVRFVISEEQFRRSKKIAKYGVRLWQLRSITRPCEPCPSTAPYRIVSTMWLGRQRNHTRAKASYRRRRWRFATTLMLRSHFSKEVQRYYLRTKFIATSQFSTNFQTLPDSLSLSLFRFKKADVLRMVEAINWPGGWGYTKRNRYRCDPLLVTPISQEFVVERAERYANACKSITGALENCIGFIDGTVIGIAQLGDHAARNVAYIGHKRKHALKYQAVTTPDRLILHAHGPLKGG